MVIKNLRCIVMMNIRGIVKRKVSLAMKRFNDRYSTSKHLLILYSIAKGLKAKKILEIGFGRSTVVLARAAFENGGKLVSCDWDDFSYLLTEEEKKVIDFVFDEADLIWNEDEGYDLAFLDHFSKPEKKIPYLIAEVEKCMKRMKKNSIIVIHDVFMDNYRIGSAIEQMVKNRDDLEYSVIPFNYGLGVLRCKFDSKYGTTVLSNNLLKK
jgi:predicted O-methyltransferase YrrM